MNLKNIIRVKEVRHKRTNTVQPHIYQIFKIGKLIKTESRSVILKDLEESRMGRNYSLNKSFKVLLFYGCNKKKT